MITHDNKDKFIVPGMPTSMAEILAVLNGKTPVPRAALLVAEGRTLSEIFENTADFIEKARPTHLYNLNAYRAAIGPMAPKPLIIGDTVNDKGVYIGQWTPVYEEGSRIIRTFNLFATPSELKSMSDKHDDFTYNEAIDFISHMQDYHGHDGSSLKTEAEIFDAIKNNDLEKLEKWFMPTRQIIEDHIADNTTNAKISRIFNDDFNKNYLTSTETVKSRFGVDYDYITRINITDRSIKIAHKHKIRSSLFAVRAELVKPKRNNQGTARGIDGLL